LHRTPTHPTRVTHSVLALHHGYRVAGGEERAATLLADLAEERLGERVAWLRRDSGALTAADAARGLLAGGLGGRQVTDALERTGAGLVHAHNLFPTFGPVALKAARKHGAAVVVHLHNTRLICAVATNVRDGKDCTDCSAGWSLPGVVHRCRGNVPESLAYGAALPRWRREVVRLADAVIVPSMSARSRLLSMGLGLPADAMHVVGGVATDVATRSTASSGTFALVVGRLAPEKDLETAIDACGEFGLPLVIAGDGPEMARLVEHAGRPRARRTEPRRLRARTESYPVRRAARGKTADAAGDGDTAGVASDAASSESAVRSGSVRPGAGAREILGDELLLTLPRAPVVRGSTVFLGRVDDVVLSMLRARACVALAPSLAHETFGLAALESMSVALPTIGSRVGALPELLGEDAVVTPRSVKELAERIGALAGDDAAGERAALRARTLAGPEVVAARLGAAYDAARDRSAVRRSYR
jgi:glycosyltransferase involved in cell wall biosynthesis